MAELALLFASAFAAASLFPFQSEIYLTALYSEGRYTSLTLLIFASAGNITGSVLNWLIGRYLMGFQDRKWFPVKEKDIIKYGNYYQKYGVWSLLLAWVPIIGDPLTIIAGIFRTPLWLFIILVSISKTGRYAMLLYVLEQTL